MADYIPLVTYDYKLAFCQTTNALPHDVQQIIWKNVLDVPPPTTPPQTPIKPSPKLRNVMNKWKPTRIVF